MAILFDVVGVCSRLGVGTYVLERTGVRLIAGSQPFVTTNWMSTAWVQPTTAVSEMDSKAKALEAFEKDSRSPIAPRQKT